MTAEEIKTSVKKNRNWAALGVAVGVVLIGGYVGINYVLTPARPQIGGSGTEEIVNYVMNPRGLARLTDIEQRRFLENWHQRIATDEATRKELTEHLRGLDDKARKQFVNTMVVRLKDIMVADSKQYKQLPANEQNDFVFNKTEEFAEQRAFLEEIARIFESDLPDPSKLRGWIFEITTPQERELIEPYFAALQRAAESRKKLDRAREAANAQAEDA